MAKPFLERLFASNVKTYFLEKIRNMISLSSAVLAQILVKINEHQQSSGLLTALYKKYIHV